MARTHFVLPYRPAFDANGLAIPGAEATFYLSGTSTKATIYADSSSSTERSNPIVANSAGRWPSTYLNEDVTYRVVITDADGVTLEEFDPYQAAIVVEGADGGAGPAGGNVESMGLFTTLTNASVPSGTTTVRSSGYRAIGVGAARYVYDSTLTDAYVIANSRSSFRALDGRIFKLDVSSGIVSVDQLGAYGNGTLVGSTYTGTDDTSAFDAALALAKEVHVGPKTYMVDRLTDVIVVGAGQSLIGVQGVSRIAKVPLPGGSSQSVANVLIRKNGTGTISNLLLEVQKSGIGRGSLMRCGGVTCTGSDWLVENVQTRNVTGYGFWAVTALDGTFRKVRSENADVQFEVINSQNIIFEDFTADRGDGDCGGNGAIEIYDTVGGNTIETRNIVFRNGRGVDLNGSCAAIGLTNGPVYDVVFEDLDFSTSGNLTAFNVGPGDGTYRMNNLKLRNCRFVCTGEGNAIALEHTDVVTMEGVIAEGHSAGIGLGADCDNIRMVNMNVIGRLFYGLDTASSTNVSFDGYANGANTDIAGNCLISNTSVLEHAGGGGTVQLRTIGQAVLESAGGTDSRAIINFANQIVDPAKVHVSATIRNADGDYGGPVTIPNNQMAWSFVNLGTVVILFKDSGGGSMVGKTISYKIEEGS